MTDGNTFPGTPDVAVGDALGAIITVVMGIETPGQVVNCEIANTGANPFTDFSIQLQDHPSGEFYDYLLAADFALGESSNLLFVSSDPTILAAAAKVHIIFRANAAYAFKLLAKRTTATTATVRGNWRGA